MSGWATVTVLANDEQDAQTLRDAFAEMTEREVETYIRNDTRVEVLDWGYGSGDAKHVLKQHADRWTDAIVMECNDTSDSGSGSYLTSDENGVVDTEASASGYEGARGHDAAGELRTKSGIRPYMR